MRQIGTLPKGLNAKAFADYLLSLGMKNRIDERPEGWDVWIYNEDHVPRARDELRGYLDRPDDPRYREATATAETIRRKEQKLDKQFRKNFRDASDLWGAPGIRRRPLTVTLIAVCVAVFIWQKSESGRMNSGRLHFTTTALAADGHVRDNGLDDILHGEVWRLVTPIFMHGSPLHLFFNMSCLAYFGTLIEVRRGTLRLAILVLAAAIVSNLGQYLWMQRIEDVAPFYGMSGVVYALFGYVWIKGLYEPEQGMMAGPNTVNMMLLWLVFCMTGLLGPVANAAHFLGLAVGILFGVFRF